MQQELGVRKEFAGLDQEAGRCKQQPWPHFVRSSPVRYREAAAATAVSTSFSSAATSG